MRFRPFDKATGRGWATALIRVEPEEDSLPGHGDDVSWRGTAFSDATMALAHDGLVMNGVASPACFFIRLAAFFSFGVSLACFLSSLLDRCGLDIVFAPALIDHSREAAWRVHPKTDGCGQD